jgi:hypothetical protein
MKKLPISLLLFSLIYLSSCTKEGPAGPTGPQGPAGPTGPTGGTGSTGSVIYTRTFTVTPSQWQWNGSLYLYYVDLSYPELTSNFLSNGAVVGYRNRSNTDLWNFLPNTFYPTVGVNLSYTWEIAYITVGTVRLRYLWSDSRQEPPTSTETFRIVAIGK